MRKFTSLLLAMLLILFGGFNQLHAVTCDQAQAIPAFPGFPWVSSLTCGTTNDITNANSTTCGNINYKGGKEALYVWTPGGNHANVSFAYSGQTRTGLFLYQGCPTAGGICIATFTSTTASKTLAYIGNNQTSGAPISLTGGVTYYLLIDTWPSPASPCPGTITINATPMFPCSGTPEPGNTLSSADPAGPTLDFSLSLENVIPGTGVSYQWQKSDDESEWDNVGTDAPIFVTSQTEATWYRCIVTCANSAESGISTPLYLTLAESLAGNYTINQTAKSSKSNFASFNEFAAAINLGGLAGPVTVDVVAGTGPYIEQVMFTALPFSSAVNTVTINGNGETLEFLSTTTNPRHTLAFNGTDHVTVNDLIIKTLGSATGEFGRAVWLTNGADYNSFYNCSFIASTTSVNTNIAGFVASNSPTSTQSAGLSASYLTVENCTAVGGYTGMAINGSNEAPFSENNTIVNNQIRDFHQWGLFLRGLNNSIIAGNVITRPTRPASATLYMIQITQNMSGTVIMNNQMYDFSPSAVSTSNTYGIYGTSVNATPGVELLIANNVIYGFQNVNSPQYGIRLDNTSNTKIYHNSISLDNVAHPGNHLIRGIHHTGNPIEGIPSAIDIRNNIISVTSNSTGTKHCLYFVQTEANLPELTSDNNVLYMGATAGANHIAYWSETNYTTLADWQGVAAGSFDQNSVDADPIFVSPMLTPSNLTVNDIGQKLWDAYPVLANDIFGTVRGENPDPGAIESSAPVCEAPTDLLAGDITAESAVLSWTPGGNEIAWNIEWGTEGFEPGSGILINGITDSSYELDGLEPGTAYEFYVQSDCGDELKMMSELVGPQSFTTGPGQRIMIPSGNQWGYVSSYIDLSSKIVLEELLAAILNEMTILIGSNGIFWPSQQINTIGEWNTYTGYKLKMSGNGSLVFPGEAVGNKTVTYPAGTYIIPVLSEVPVDAMELFEGHNIEFAFDLGGAIYWPNGGLYTLNELIPGYGYLVRFNSTATLDFSAAKQSTSPNSISIISYNPWNEINKTGDVHIIGFTDGALDVLQQGDIIGAFNADGLCTGVVAHQSNQSEVMVIYGNDMATAITDGMNAGELLNLKIYRNGDILELNPTFSPKMPDADGLFAVNGFSVITDLKVSATGTGIFDAQLISIAPNPSKGMFNIYGVNQSTQIAVINSKGQTVYAGQIIKPGTLDLSNQPAGVYFIRIIGKDQIRTEKLIID